MTADDPMTDFGSSEVVIDGVGKVVHTSGAGPAVIVLAEMPGISPHVLRFARWVRDAGFTAVLPSLFGRDGAFPRADEGLAVLRRACVSTEMRAFAGGGSSPVTAWLRELARRLQVTHGGPGVGVVGMCFTGGFALSMMLEPAVLAPVMCQPSLPLDDPASIDVDVADLARIRRRLDDDDLTVLAYRFEGDRHCTALRFAALSAALGDRFRPRTLPDLAANPDPPPFFADVVGGPHSVVTAHLVDEAGHPTIAARDEILAFLAERLSPHR